MNGDTLISKHTPPFMHGGGEMGRLMRDHDWEGTSLGRPEEWSHSLRTTLGLLLHSAFPMFLFWGEDLNCFYNDAFLPSLGANGKHPALGKSGKEVWPEIWDTIGPMIDQVMSTGKPVFFEDMLVPFYRNGRIEDIFWTFSYSPAYDDNGEVNGVFVVCYETTDKISTISKLSESEQRFQNMIREAVVGMIVLTGPEMTVQIVNEAYGRLVNLKADELLGKPLFTMIPLAEERFLPLLEKVRATGESLYLFDQPYEVVTNGVRTEGRVNALYQPYRELDGTTTGVLAIVQDISELSETIREKDKLISIIEGSQEFIGLASPDGQVQYLSPAGLRMLGLERCEGLNIKDTIYPGDLQIAAQLLDKLMDEGHISHEIRLINRRTNHVFWILWNAFVIRHPETGTITALATVSPNITGRKEAEEALERSEQKLRSVVEGAPFPIAVYEGPELYIRFANEAIMNIYGKGPHVIGRKYFELLPELLDQPIAQEIRDVYVTGIPFHAKYQRVDIVMDGKLQPFYFNYSFTPLKDTEGNVYGILNTGAEVTDMVLAKQKIEETEAHLRGAVEIAELVTWSMDIEKQEFSYSPRFMEWLGFSEDTKSLDEAYNPLPDEYRESVSKAIASAIAPGGSGFYENEHPIVNWLTGQTRIIHAQAQVFKDSNGRPKALAGTARDVTEERKRQEELERQVAERTRQLAAYAEQLSTSNEQLMRSNEELAQYAYVTSHDLQEPLRKIRTFASMLDERKLSEEQSQSLIARISSSSERMSNLIQGLLEFSRLLKSEEHVQTIDLNTIVKAVIDDFELAVQEKDAMITVGKLPILEGVSLQMNQLFYNLIGNALKFSKTDVPAIVSIEARKLDSSELGAYITKPIAGAPYYLIAVSDNGIGFEPEYSEQIFEMFKRLHSRDHYPGSGIGLSLCRRIVANHKGMMQASSVPGSGTTFNIVLPGTQS